MIFSQLPSASPTPCLTSLQASKVWVPNGNWPTVLDFLASQFAHISRQEWQSRLDQGLVRCLNQHQNSRLLNALDPCPYQTHIEYFRQLQQEPAVPFEAAIIFENEYIVVADKPHFLPVTPVGSFIENTLQSRLQKQLACPMLQVVHRLDRETAGLVLLVKKPQYRNTYQALFREQTIHKVYEAVAPYRHDLIYPLLHQSYLASSGQFFLQTESIAPSNGPKFNSSTLIEVKQVLSQNKALYRLTPSTGKKHQLRVHMASLGIGIEGDQFYPVAKSQNLTDFSQPLQLLAQSLTFTDPISGQNFNFVSQQNLAMAQTLAKQ